MKKNLLILISALSILILGGCKDNSWKEKEKKLQDSFAQIQETQTSKMETFIKNLNEIDSTLHEVNQMYISARENTDNSIPATDLVESIKQQIEVVKQRLDTQKEKVVVMQKESPNANVSGLMQMISNLQIRIIEKQQEIDRLTALIKDKDRQIESLESSYQSNVKALHAENSKKDVRISEMEDAQNTAYFIIGTRYELQKKGVINEKGGFIGIGKWPVIASNSDLAIMKKIDIRNTRQIPLSGQRATIITPHNTTSFSLEGNHNNPTAINIKDPSLFWRTSHCLVVVIN
ncbi:MAG: hypothetical protein LBL74_03705 [Bacteroidales bacterium]|jgi:hypothetical protein|nr:hypothetical protein [Bacteroidales bacterium]